MLPILYQLGKHTIPTSAYKRSYLLISNKLLSVTIGFLESGIQMREKI